MKLWIALALLNTAGLCVLLYSYEPIWIVWLYPPFLVVGTFVVGFNAGYAKRKGETND